MSPEASSVFFLPVILLYPHRDFLHMEVKRERKGWKKKDGEEERNRGKERET